MFIKKGKNKIVVLRLIDDPFQEGVSTGTEGKFNDFNTRFRINYTDSSSWKQTVDDISVKAVSQIIGTPEDSRRYNEILGAR